MTAGKYLTVAALFMLGVGLSAFGATSSAEATLWGITFQARLARGLGILTALGSSITFLVLYGNSLPPNQTERRLEATRALRRGEQPLRRKKARGGWDRFIVEPTQGESRPSISMGRTMTEGWLRAVADRRDSQASTATGPPKHAEERSSDDLHSADCAQTQRTLRHF